MKILSAILLGTLIGVLVLLPALAPQSLAQKKTLVVGSSRSPEQIIMAKLVIRLLEDKGFSCRDMTGLGGDKMVRSALINGQVDLYPAWTEEVEVEEGEGPGPGAGRALFEAVRTKDLAQNRLVWLDPAGLEKTLRIWLRPRWAQARKLTTISGLAAFARARPEKPFLGLTQKFLIDPEGYPALAQTYGLDLPPDRIIKMDPLLLYLALEDDGVDAVFGGSLDWEPASRNLTALRDDLGFFRPSYLSAVVRLETLEQHPDLQPLVSTLAPLLTTSALAELIGRVEQGTDYSLIAPPWLKEKGLIAP